MHCRWIVLQSAALALVMSGWAGLPAGLASSTIRSSRLWTDASEEVAPSNIDVAPKLVTANDAAPPVTDLAATELSDLDSVLGAEEQVSCQPGCCGVCNSGCACRKKCVCQHRLLGLIAPSDPCFREFISPLTNPLFFEDPRTLTEARTIFAHQWIPAANPVFGGGQAQYVAMQMRAALTKRLSLIATKDGYFWIDPAIPGAPSIDGWANLALGLKYNLIRDPEYQRIWSAGLTYQPPTGTTRVFQGLAGGEFHAFISGGRHILGRGHWLTGVGYRAAATSDLTDMIYWSNHWDYEILPTLYGLMEINWFNWTRSGTRLPVAFEGNDLVNLGATGVAGNNIVTMGVGARKRFGRVKKHELGAGYEYPLTARRDLLNDRLYLDLLLRF